MHCHADAENDDNATALLHAGLEPIRRLAQAN